MDHPITKEINCSRFILCNSPQLSVRGLLTVHVQGKLFREVNNSVIS